MKVLIKNDRISHFMVFEKRNKLDICEFIFLTDKSNAVLDKLVKKGNLIVLKSFLASKASPKKEEVPQTVAQTDPKSSVQ